jgi:predicted acyl esterase
MCARFCSWIAAAAAVACIWTAGVAAGTPTWWSYDRPAAYDPAESHVFVPTRDGTLLGCDLYQPGHASALAAGRFPGVVAEFTPYYAFRPLASSQADFLASHGYDVIVCNLRGTGDSGGLWPGIDAPVETTDNYDLIEWLAAQPWSNGRIGQEGFSYGGFTTYRVAALHPPHLLALLPMASQANLYLESQYPGGIPATPGGSHNNWPPIAFAASGGRIDPAVEWATWSSHPTFDDYWKQVAVSTKYSQITLPILGTGGWDDVYFRSAMVSNYLGLKSHSWLIYGPWGHTDPFAWPGGGGAPTEPVPAGAVLAWWDHWLMQLKSAPLPSARFTSYEEPVGSGAGWQELSDWPPPDVHNTQLALTGAGSLTAKAGPSGIVSLPEPSDSSVTFTTGPLKGDTVLAGSVGMHLQAGLSAPDANFYVQLLDVAPDGTSTLVNDGYLLASHRLSHEDPTPVPIGQTTEFTFDVWPDNWRFAAGHRIRLTISGGDPSELEPPPTPVTVAILVGAKASYAVLPLRGNGGKNVP